MGGRGIMGKVRGQEIYPRNTNGELKIAARH